MFITLTTDFGLQDAYVGIMKGVMARIAPEVHFLDITHQVPPQDVRAGAYLLWAALPYMPSESVHLVVVDPGVGTKRRAIATQTSWGILVGPDNGVFSYVWAAASSTAVVELKNPQYHRDVVSATFHGRDIFAPVTAHLAAGARLRDVGSPIDDPVRLPLPRLEASEEQVTGEVLYVDHFGNAVTSIGRLVWEGGFLHLDAAFGGSERMLLRADQLNVRVGDRDLGAVQRTYGAVKPGEPLALVGSEGMLELAVSQGSGADHLAVQVGDPVYLYVT